MASDDLSVIGAASADVAGTRLALSRARERVSDRQRQSDAARAVIDRIAAMIDPAVPLDYQHDVKFLWHRENLEAVLQGKPFSARPITMEIDPALDCNFGCPHCTYGQWERRTRGLKDARQMSRQEMEVILHRVADGGVRGLIFTGGGEPFVNPHTPFGIGTAQRLGIRTGIFTNGSLLTPQIISQILAADPEFLRVSVNAVSAGVYGAFHGLHNADLAEHVWSNVRCIAGTIGQARTSFGLGVVVKRVNSGDILNVIRKALDIIEAGGRIDYVGVRPVVNYWGQKQISPEILSRVREAHEIGQRMAEGSGLKLFFAMDYFEKVAAASGRAPVTVSGHCVGHSWLASIAYTGDVYLCSEGKGSPQNRLGNLLEQTLDEIWESVLRQQVIGGTCAVPAVCKARRITEQVTQLMDIGPLKPEELPIVNDFLAEIRSAGSPGAPDFL